MPSTARKIAISDSLVDINEATAHELRDALPGIGDILARRIVEYRNEHGPFEHPDDLMRVPGLNGKRLSKFAPRVSIAPNSGFRLPTPANGLSSPPAVDEFVQPMPIFSIESDPLPGYNAPSMTSLMPNGPEESIGEPFRPSAMPAAPEGQYVVGGSLLAGPRDSMAAAPSLSTRPEAQAAVEEDMLGIPFHRPLRVAAALAAIGLFSAILGATLGIRSQDGGPRTRVVEQRVGRVESNVNDLSGSVRALEGQASAFASSINALDARISQQTQRSVQPAPASVAKAAPVVEVAREPESHVSATRRRVRQALRELDPVAPPSTRTP